MDDEDYQRIADYENEIYDLNHQTSEEDDKAHTARQSVPDQQSVEEADSREGTSEPGQPNGIVSHSPPNGVKDIMQPNVEYFIHDEVHESSGLSEDERDEIYARLYHGNTVIPTTAKLARTKPEETSNKSSSSKKKKSKTKSPNGTNHFSNEFTFDIDLDNLPPPPEPSIPEVSTLDSDGDFSIPSRGRYFGLIEPDRPAPGPIICFRCNQPGHIKADCPHQICRICNALDSHPTHRCPTRITCPNCSQTGHRRADCPFSRNLDPSKPCAMCGDYGHFEATCHQIWRYYRPVEPSKLEMVSVIRRYCYNCAEEGHLGDDCGAMRPYYVQGGRPGVLVSAFGEGNVPEWAKTIPPPENKKRRREEPMIPKRRTHQRDERRNDDQDDGWFARGEREPPPPPSLAKRIGGIKIPKSLRRDAIANAAEPRRATNLDRPPPLPNEPVPRDPPPYRRDRSPGRDSYASSSSVDSYRPRYAQRGGQGDWGRAERWEEEQAKWRRRQDEETAERDSYRPNYRR